MTSSKPEAGNVVPGSLDQAAVTTRYTFLDYIRSRRFAILLILMLIISALLTFVFAWRRPATALVDPLAFYSTWWGMSATFVVILSGIFFGGDAISSEFQNRTGYFVLPNPVRRSSVYVGKYVAALIASSIILLIFTLITVANGLYYFGFNVPGVFWESAFFDWIYLLAVLGFTFFISSAFKSGAYSILVSAVFLLFGFSLIEDLVANLANTEPWFVLSYGGEIVANVLKSPYPPPFTTSTFGSGSHSFTVTTYNVAVSEGLIILAVYFIVTAILGLLIFERKEFN
jgi:ABC-2 type transport system permease protein